MGNTPSHQHGQNPQQGSGSQSHPQKEGHSGKGPGLKLPMPQRSGHISPQSSHPASPSGQRSSSPRRRKSLELPDLTKLSFTPAAPVPTTAVANVHSADHSTASQVPQASTSTSTSTSTATSGQGAISGGNALLVPASGPILGASSSSSGSSHAGVKKWQQTMLGGRSPLAGANALSPMSRLEPMSSSAPSQAPQETSYFSSSAPDRSASPRRSIPIPIPGASPGVGSGAGTNSPALPSQPVPASATRPTGPPSTSGAPPPPLEPALDIIPKDGKIDVSINWSGGGREVYVAGTFDKESWKNRIKLVRSSHDFHTTLRLAPGQYRLKFIVDESWRCSKDIPTATDDDGTLVNWIEVEHPKTAEELRAEWAIDANAPVKTEHVDESEWTNQIPESLILYTYLEEIPHIMDETHGEGAYAVWAKDKYLTNVPLPPMLPRLLEKVIVNAETRRDESHPNGTVSKEKLDDNSILAVPNHVVLNHLTASAVRAGTLGVGTTTRYRKKYITTMFFKPTLADLEASNDARSASSPNGQ